jgi:hypothetical protein
MPLDQGLLLFGPGLSVVYMSVILGLFQKFERALVRNSVMNCLVWRSCFKRTEKQTKLMCSLAFSGW